MGVRHYDSMAVHSGKCTRMETGSATVPREMQAVFDYRAGQ